MDTASDKWIVFRGHLARKRGGEDVRRWLTLVSQADHILTQERDLEEDVHVSPAVSPLA
jgi:hypothetical protein